MHIVTQNLEGAQMEVWWLLPCNYNAGFCMFMLLLMSLLLFKSAFETWLLRQIFFWKSQVINYSTQSITGRGTACSISASNINELQVVYSDEYSYCPPYYTVKLVFSSVTRMTGCFPDTKVSMPGFHSIPGPHTYLGHPEFVQCEFPLGMDGWKTTETFYHKHQ